MSSVDFDMYNKNEKVLTNNQIGNELFLSCVIENCSKLTD